AGVPVFLYGDLASHQSHRERSFFRAGGLVELRRRLAGGELRPDFGPPELHPTAGATLVTARPPLAAFNVVLEGATIVEARETALAGWPDEVPLPAFDPAKHVIERRVRAA